MDTNGYANPKALVSTEWLNAHLNDPSIRVIEAVWGKDDYAINHIPGALPWEFVDDLGGTTSQPDLVNQNKLEELLSRSGISQQTTVVVYSGISNLLATFTFWVLKLYGHSDVRLLDGGREKWIQDGYPLSDEIEHVTPSSYQASPLNWKYRADKKIVLDAIGKGDIAILDARPADQFRGEESLGIARAGHIPGAVNIPADMEKNEDGSFKRWTSLYTESDGTFRSKDELQKTVDQEGITRDKEIITYCVRGGLSTQAWFALTQLLGYPNVREYERSWEEWGSQIDLPIEG